MILRVKTEDGIEGIGVSFFGGALSATLKQAVDQLGELIVGEDPLRVVVLPRDAGVLLQIPGFIDFDTTVVIAFLSRFLRPPASAAEMGYVTELARGIPKPRRVCVRADGVVNGCGTGRRGLWWYSGTRNGPRCH